MIDRKKRVMELESLSRAIELEPTNSFHYHERARLNRAIDDSIAALADYGKAIEYDPGNAELFCERADLFYFDLDEDELALADYATAEFLDPALPDVPFFRSALYLKNGDYTRAVTDCTRAMELFGRNVPDWFDYYLILTRAETYYHLGDFEKAIDDCSWMIEHHPADPWLYCLRGIFRQRRGDQAGANRDFEKARSLSGSEAEFHHEKSKAHVKLEQYESVVAESDAAIRLNPAIAKYHAQRAEALSMLCLCEDSAEAFSEAIRLESEANPPEGLFLYYLGRAGVWDKLGQSENAAADRRTAEEISQTRANHK